MGGQVVGGFFRSPPNIRAEGSHVPLSRLSGYWYMAGHRRRWGLRGRVEIGRGEVCCARCARRSSRAPLEVAILSFSWLPVVAQGHNYMSKARQYLKRHSSSHGWTLLREAIFGPQGRQLVRELSIQKER